MNAYEVKEEVGGVSDRSTFVLDFFAFFANFLAAFFSAFSAIFNSFFCLDIYPSIEASLNENSRFGSTRRPSAGSC